MAGRPKGSTTKAKTEESKAKTKVVEEVKEIDANTELIKQLMAQIEEQNKKMAELQTQINNNNKTETVLNTNNFGSKRIKCINLMQNPVNVATQPNGQGRVFEFKEYGDSILIKFDDLAEIVASYPNTMERGLIYIANKDAVEALGLSDYYEKLFDKKTLDKMVKMQDETDLEIFLGISNEMQKSYARDIATRINANERVDYNALNRIKEETEIDIIAIAEAMKAETEAREKANKKDR